MSDSKQSANFLSVEEAINHGPRKPSPGPFWKALLTCFALFYFLTVLVWMMPDGPSKNRLLNYTEKPMQAFGWYQHWSVFAPYLRTQNYHETAVITFKDGSTKIYEYPRMNKISLWEKFRREKLRKMFSDCMPWPGYKILLPVFARHLAQSNHNQDNPPIIISYVFNWITYDGPERGELVLRNKMPEHTNKEITFVYKVDQSDLEIEKHKNRFR